VTYAIPSLVGVILLLCGSVAALADLARDRQPMVRPQAAQAFASVLWVVQAGDGRWFVNGEPVSGSRLPRVLEAQPSRAEIRFLPAATLPLGQVARSLAQLRSISTRPVALALPEERP
jgi:hypothetical protein